MKKALFNPLENNSPRKLFLLGMVFTIIGCTLAAIFNARFDGVLDLHFVKNSWWQPVLDNGINIIISTLSLWAAGKYLNNKTRLWDMLAISVYARFPIYLLPLANLNDFMISVERQVRNTVFEQGIPSFNPAVLIGVLAFALFSILLIIGYLTMLFNGYRVAAHAKGTKSIVFFIIAIVFMEVFSKILISLINF